MPSTDTATSTSTSTATSTSTSTTPATSTSTTPATSTATTPATSTSTATTPATSTSTATASKTATSVPTVDKSTTINSESKVGDDLKTILNSTFSSNNIMLVLWFLAAYLLTYVAMGIFNASETGPSNIIRILDVVILLAIFAYIFLSYYSTPSEKRDDKMKNIWSSMYTILNDPYTLLYTGIFLAVFGAITFITHIPISGPGASVSLWLLSTVAGILFTITAIVVFCKEVLGISLLDSETFDKLFGKSDSSKDKKDDKSTSTSAKSSTASVKTDEVFNISNNLYTYDDARAVCSAFGARLATYDEIEDAYSKGGEWCNYGWSEGQMAFFPTQKSTWDQLQKNPKTKNNCGRPGVNGGYMENPYIKFGVNCFGQKPKATDKDLKSMAANKSLPQAKTADDLLLEKKVKFWKENADKLLQVNSFNRDKWSEY